jgi:hypothetical protein
MADTPEERSTPRACGSCSLCCKLLAVPEFDKPANVWCQHAAPEGRGCAIYATRPDGCRRFKCNWLTDLALSDAWKPNASKIIVSRTAGGGGLRVSVYPEAKDAWRGEPFYSQIKQWSQATAVGTGYVALFIGEKCFVVFPEEELEVSYIKQGCAVRAGYLDSQSGRQPIVQIRYADGAMKEFRGATYPARAS